MSAATAQQPQPPSIPPRPSRSQEKSTPMVPPRPANRKIQRSLSPSRFAPSPLNESPLRAKSPRSSRFGQNGNGQNGDSIDRSKSVELPQAAGEEGLEYASLDHEVHSSREQTSSPEHTRTVGDDVKLYAPKPSLPAVSAKQRVMAVTRTDSDRAASFGIGKPSSVDDSTHALPSNRSLKKKASTTSQLSNTTEGPLDDEQGIPEIGIQVPMYPNAGDVQAPSPAPTSTTFGEGVKGKHHSRRTSSRGNLPPGSYGLHGHGVAPQDKLEKAYYEKHPDLLKKEITPHHHDRANDFSMSKEDLEKIVRETARLGSGLAVKNYASTPSDQIGWQALEETTSRVASPRPGSAEARRPSSVKGSDSENPAVVHVDEPGSRRKSVLFSDSESPSPEDAEEHHYTAPILAEDEIAKDPSPYTNQPAVEPAPERRGSAFEMEDAPSRPTSRPASLYKETSFELRPTPLEDVEEYEPLFDEDDNKKPKKPAEERIKSEHKKRRFPSADIWEDAPSSVHYTAEVSTPEPSEAPATAQTKQPTPPARDGETPAQAFARHQEELAEREVRERGPDSFLPGRKKDKPQWLPLQAAAPHKSHLAPPEPASHRPSAAQRFPSRDVWEDTPDSHMLEATVSTPQQDAIPGSPVETAKAERPAIPGRPKPRQSSGDAGKPPISERPKPQIPARPVKASPTSGGQEPADAAAASKAKPAVPARPMGSKIAALQAGFMNDLNQRLRLGPQAPKKEEPVAEEEPAEEKEKAPLADARKGRARGPQRRAPAKSASPAPAVEAKTEPEAQKFVFSQAVTFFEVNPEEGSVNVGSSSAEPEPALGTKVEPSTDAAVEAKAEPEVEEAKPTTEEESEEASEDAPKVEEQTLATNMAGETVVEERAIKPGVGLPVEPVDVAEK